MKHRQRIHGAFMPFERFRVNASFGIPDPDRIVGRTRGKPVIRKLRDFRRARNRIWPQARQSLFAHRSGARRAFRPLAARCAPRFPFRPGTARLEKYIPLLHTLEPRVRFVVINPYYSQVETPFKTQKWLLTAALALVITLEDCIQFCGLTKEEVLAIAEHEHVPEIAATALASHLLCQEHGTGKVRDMIVDDIRRSQLRGDRKHVLELLHVLHHFLKTHPEAKPPAQPWSWRFRHRMLCGESF